MVFVNNINIGRGNILPLVVFPVFCIFTFFNLKVHKTIISILFFKIILLIYSVLA